MSQKCVGITAEARAREKANAKINFILNQDQLLE